MFCTQCGSQIKDNAKFCSKCGARVGGEPVQPQPQQTEEYYTVVKGDTATKISIKYGISLTEFKKLNPQIQNISRIYVGQKVRVK